MNTDMKWRSNSRQSYVKQSKWRVSRVWPLWWASFMLQTLASQGLARPLDLLWCSERCSHLLPSVLASMFGFCAPYITLKSWPCPKRSQHSLAPNCRFSERSFNKRPSPVCRFSTETEVIFWRYDSSTIYSSWTCIASMAKSNIRLL